LKVNTSILFCCRTDPVVSVVYRQEERMTKIHTSLNCKLCTWVWTNVFILTTQM
jgi:hypothetical protein